MSDKNIPKKTLDKLLDLTRTYYGGDTLANEDALAEMIREYRRMEADVAIGCFALLDFIASIIRYSGLKRDATNDDIYKVLEVLGWTVE